MLTYDKLRRALLQVEIFMNQRPLTYVGEEPDQRVLTPNVLLDKNISSMEPDLEDVDFKEENIPSKRMKYLERIHHLLRKCWQNEYLQALQEKHTRDPDRNQEIPAPG